jgi:hypothetical protein
VNPARSPDDDRRNLIAEHVLQFLRAVMGPGDECDVAVHPEREQVVVFINGEPALDCTFDELIAGPGYSLN